MGYVGRYCIVDLAQKSLITYNAQGKGDCNLKSPKNTAKNSKQNKFGAIKYR